MSMQPDPKELLEAARRLDAAKQKAKSEPEPAVGDLTGLLAEPITMPNEGLVWVHPLSLEEDMWAVSQAAKEVRDLKLKDPDEAKYYLNLRANVYHVIAACRKGQEFETEKVYAAGDAKRLRTNPAYRAKVLQAVAISERLGSDGWTREAFDLFFDAMRARLAVWCSPSSTDSIAISRAELEAFIGFLSLTQQRRALSIEEMPELTAPPEVPAATPARARAKRPVN